MIKLVHNITVDNKFSGGYTPDPITRGGEPPPVTSPWRPPSPIFRRSNFAPPPRQHSSWICHWLLTNYQPIIGQWPIAVEKFKNLTFLPFKLKNNLWIVIRALNCWLTWFVLLTTCTSITLWIFLFDWCIMYVALQRINTVQICR